MLEKGKNIPSKRLSELMCLKFNINIDWLLTGEGEMRKYPLPEGEKPDNISEIIDTIYKGKDLEIKEILSLLLESPQDKGWVLKMLKGKKEIKEGSKGFGFRVILREEE
jgi:hypothetical protein